MHVFSYATLHFISTRLDLCCVVLDFTLGLVYPFGLYYELLWFSKLYFYYKYLASMHYTTLNCIFTKQYSNGSILCTTLWYTLLYSTLILHCIMPTFSTMWFIRVIQFCPVLDYTDWSLQDCNTLDSKSHCNLAGLVMMSWIDLTDVTLLLMVLWS